VTVAELRIILEHLPDDLEVRLPSGSISAHVRHVERKVSRRSNLEWTLAGNRFPAGLFPPSVEMSATGFTIFREPAVGWWLEPPPIRLSGPFRAARLLDERLNELRGAG
jgi:hypothetical protein